MAQVKSKLTILEEEGLENNPNYKAFSEEKKQLKSKYSPSLWKYPTQGRTNIKNTISYVKSEHDEYKKYLSDIADIMLKPNSNFQKFVWDIIPEYELAEMERRTRGRKNKNDML